MNTQTFYIKLHKFHLIKYQKVLKLIQLLFWQNNLKYTLVLSLNTIPKFGHPKKKINKIESVQRNFTRFVCSRCNISNTSYNDRLVKLGLKYLENRRWEFDLFTFYKIINGKYKGFSVNFSVFSHNKYLLRGSVRKIKCIHNFNNSLWQGSFFHRAKTMWNKLSQDVVSCEIAVNFRL